MKAPPNAPSAIRLTLTPAEYVRMAKTFSEFYRLCEMFLDVPESYFDDEIHKGIGNATRKARDQFKAKGGIFPQSDEAFDDDQYRDQKLKAFKRKQLASKKQTSAK